MAAILKRIPLPISGLILGIAGLGNLVQSDGDVFRNILGVIAGLLFILYSLKLAFFPKIVRGELSNPVMASVFPTYPMSMVLLSTYVKPFSFNVAFGMWVLGFTLHLGLIIWFCRTFVVRFNINEVFPTWFIVFVGVGIGSVTANVFGMEEIGRIGFRFGLISYLILLAVILFRVIKVRQMPEPTLPTLMIFAAPASLCLAGYINSFPEKSLGMVYFLMSFSLAFYLLALVIFPRLVKLKFYPSFSGFTFPLVISGTGIKLANGFLGEADLVIPLLKYLVNFQEAIAVLVTLYVLGKYVGFFFNTGLEI